MLNPGFELTLALLVARIIAHDEHHPAAANDFTMVTQTLNAGADFHWPVTPLSANPFTPLHMQCSNTSADLGWLKAPQYKATDSESTRGGIHGSYDRQAGIAQIAQFTPADF